MTNELTERGLVHDVQTPIMAIDDSFTVTFLNRAGADVVGIVPEEAAGRKCYDLFKTPHCRTEHCACARAMREGRRVTAETEVDPGGAAIPIEYTGAPIVGKDGRVIGALEYVVDITERKAMLRAIAGFAERLAAGSLDARIEGDFQGDFGIIAERLNAASEVLCSAMAEVSSAAEQVTVAAGEVASGSESLAQAATEQASSLEETSSSLEQLSSSTRQNALATQQARGLAAEMETKASSGADAMARLQRSMDEIETAAAQTAEIIRDINEIAFQTNLLALNAAVEAARAGDAGRGFAVVAGEVRNLAQRAKEAAKRTEDLIKRSSHLASDGRRTASETNERLQQVVTAIGRVSVLVAEIAAASGEQSKGIALINGAVGEMDRVVQASAASAEQSASAAAELSGQAGALLDLVARFQLDA